jgi:acyl transferase domain-containing protein
VRAAGATPNAVAIVSMAGRFPGAPNLDRFWANLRDGVESIVPVSDDELRKQGVDEALIGNARYVKSASTLDGVDLFDAAFFGYSPREAELLDPQQRLFLECAWEALELAGYDPRLYSGQIGVYAGASFNAYLANIFSNPEIVQSVGIMQAGMGTRGDYLPTRVSYKLNLRGPSINVQTASATWHSPAARPSPWGCRGRPATSIRKKASCRPTATAARSTRRRRERCGVTASA